MTDETKKPPMPFSQVLRTLGDGALHDELSQGYHDLLAAVIEQKKPGTLTLTLKVSPDTKMATPFVTVTDAVTVKAPQAPRPATGMFYNPKTGQQQREHPNMQPLLDSAGAVQVPAGDDDVVAIPADDAPAVTIPTED